MFSFHGPHEKYLDFSFLLNKKLNLIQWFRLVTFSGIRRTNRKGMYENKIAGMKNNACSLSNLTRNTFVLYFSIKKKNRNEQE